ncbi:hypothetical protein SCLCIDRAFT_849381 [Scleroderma citrinum Foug A]|uniref:Uncharacterized protein n=1 Tax=Scleroderma citrinum Foug A TaxID=1036808 RepID=A0A0C2ZKR6_9AGAM|nr:hypothetical protein SCLCIDRAFT_849381 [Scleroderma citrinum Foug A]
MIILVTQSGGCSLQWSCLRYSSWVLTEQPLQGQLFPHIGILGISSSRFSIDSVQLCFDVHDLHRRFNNIGPPDRAHCCHDNPHRPPASKRLASQVAEMLVFMSTAFDVARGYLVVIANASDEDVVTVYQQPVPILQGSY